MKFLVLLVLTKALSVGTLVITIRELYLGSTDLAVVLGALLSVAMITVFIALELGRQKSRRTDEK